MSCNYLNAELFLLCLCLLPLSGEAFSFSLCLSISHMCFLFLFAFSYLSPFSLSHLMSLSSFLPFLLLPDCPLSLPVPVSASLPNPLDSRA